MRFELRERNPPPAGFASQQALTGSSRVTAPLSRIYSIKTTDRRRWTQMRPAELGFRTSAGSVTV